MLLWASLISGPYNLCAPSFLMASGKWCGGVLHTDVPFVPEHSTDTLCTLTRYGVSSLGYIYTRTYMIVRRDLLGGPTRSEAGQVYNECFKDKEPK